jgi:hypothetical protein
MIGTRGKIDAGRGIDSFQSKEPTECSRDDETAEAIAAAEKIYFFQLTRHLQINLFQLGLRFIFITLHLTTFINVTSQPHLWSIVSVQWLRCIRCLGTDSSQLGRCRQYGSPWGTGAAYIIIFKNSGNKIKIPTGARRS